MKKRTLAQTAVEKGRLRKFGIRTFQRFGEMLARYKLRTILPIFRAGVWSLQNSWKIQYFLIGDLDTLVLEVIDIRLFL